MVARNKTGASHAVNLSEPLPGLPGKKRFHFLLLYKMSKGAVLTASFFVDLDYRLYRTKIKRLFIEVTDRILPFCGIIWIEDKALRRTH
ncbi:MULTISPECIES: hypothetical protein [Paenibacillus]|uniref:hypothetical protein n=1 Tax=Paenibacillus TaxID=44249 RepID=UPI0030F6874E